MRPARVSEARPVTKLRMKNDSVTHPRFHYQSIGHYIKLDNADDAILLIPPHADDRPPGHLDQSFIFYLRANAVLSTNAAAARRLEPLPYISSLVFGATWTTMTNLDRRMKY